MKIFFTQEFIDEVTLISKSNSHNDCELSLIDNIFNKNIDEIKNTGTKRLGGDPNKNPFLRKRIETSNSGKRNRSHQTPSFGGEISIDSFSKNTKGF